MVEYCERCRKKVAYKVEDIRKIYFGHVWYLTCTNGHKLIEWKKDGQS